MQYLEQLRRRGSLAMGLALALILVVAVACGSAAQEQETTAPADTAPAPAKPVETAPQQPTAVPQAAPAEPKQMAMEVNAGTVTFMTGSFGTERFDSTYGSTSPDANRHFHGYLVGSDVAKGRLLVVPGIATKWELSDGNCSELMR